MDPEVVVLESTFGVRIGLCVQDVAQRVLLVDHRRHDRFALCSTFKALLVGAVLKSGVDLDTRVTISKRALVEYSPVTGHQSRMTVGALCDAALRYSDNTAANLLLRQVGGPAGLTAFLRNHGDHTTRLDRIEPDLNSSLPGDVRDTSTADALRRTCRSLLVGPVLRPRDRWLLNAWMEANTTSVATFRAELPTFWTYADKTGSGSYGNQNDVGLITTPSGRQVVVAALSRGESAGQEGDPRLINEIAALIVRRMQTR